MSEQVTLATVRELLETQERTFKYTIELLTKNFKDDINEIKRTVEDLKTSLNFSQKDIDDIKSRIYKAEERIMEAEEGIHDAQADIDHSLDQQEYLENQSRRNNVFGIPEKDAKEGLESWEESEQLVKNEIKSKLKIEVDLNIERAHRVGKLRPQPSHRHDGSNVKIRPRPIIVRFQSWKDKEMVVKKARQLKPEIIQFYEDYSKRTLDRRKEKIPELIQARKRSKRAFLVMDRLTVTDAGPNLRDSVRPNDRDNA